MKNKILMSLLALLLVFTLGSLTSAEMTLWESVSVDTTKSLVNQHAYYQYYDDIEELSRGGQLLVDIKRTLYAGRTNDVLVWAEIQTMPYNYSLFIVNYCELNATHTITDYDSSGNLIGVNESTYGFTYSSNPLNTTWLFFKMRNRDSLIVDVNCYYNDSNNLYFDSVLLGRTGLYLPANKCNDCEEFTIEQLSNEIERADEVLAKETAIYNIIQTIIGYNYQIWLIASWLIKLGFLIMAIGLIFLGIYYLYQFIKDIEREI